MSLSKVLVANRGEIAVRIIRAARDAGLESVAVYADADARAMHVEYADEAYGLRSDGARSGYLDGSQLIEIARRSGADAIHPGYGFLSENAEFARAVSAAGLVWIGPAPDTIDLLGDKSRARALAASVGAPLLPGTNEPVKGFGDVLAFAEEHGLPLVVKAVHGGGGRGMRVVRERARIAEAYDAATREAEAAFGRGECIVERYLDAPRHLEVQVLADDHGRIIALGTRDCSLQRRNQKLVEEAPAPFIGRQLTERIEAAAVDICRAAGYRGAGTVEFLLGGDGTLSFLEVNTRLQVEHAVTEAVSGVDIVRQQFSIAAGEPMDVPSRVPACGHAIEFRINAEDPALGFLPTPGRIEGLEAPGGPGVRFDSGVRAGSDVPGDFDSLLAKLIVWGRDRGEALARARRALDELRIDGIATVLPFHRHVVRDPAFIGSEAAEFAVHTRWIEQECSADFAVSEPVPEPVAETMVRFRVEIDGRSTEIGVPTSLLANLALPAALPDAPAAERQDGGAPESLSADDAGRLRAPFAGTLSIWKAAEGARVAEGETVAILEAMKMEVPVIATRSGVLQRRVPEGAAVSSGAELAVLA